MKRRDFITLLGGAAAAWPIVVRAQHPQKMPLIGTLMPSPVEVSTSLDAFLQGLRDLGYIEGQNIAIERRFADWKLDRLPELAADLVRRNVDVIVAVSTPPGRAAQQATRTIPIVVGGMADPVGDGLVASLAQPNGNVTGTTFIGPELIAKRLGAARIAVLWHPGVYSDYTMAQMLHETEAAARTLGLELQMLAAQGPGDFDEAFAAMRRDSADALLLFPSPMLYLEHRCVVDVAKSSRLPAIYAAREFVDAGGLMSYGANLPALFRRTATYVAKIFKGAKPADLPVEQPVKFEFVVNLQTAKALALDIAPTLLARADEVIE
ncbi:MAG: ABC transporter substrate-binding protein [Alphaproteobacteria bacterium]|nr:MAG: ABC transporter substrate-binding protein [Alphaproteobacteria bacterium]